MTGVRAPEATLAPVKCNVDVLFSKGINALCALLLCFGAGDSPNAWPGAGSSDACVAQVGGSSELGVEMRWSSTRYCFETLDTILILAHATGFRSLRHLIEVYVLLEQWCPAFRSHGLYYGFS